MVLMMSVAVSPSSGYLFFDHFMGCSGTMLLGALEDIALSR
jgi:hypothetical protein